VFTPTRAFLEGMLNAEGSGTFTAHTKLNGAFLGLYTNLVQPSVNTVLADLHQATFTGYALAALTWNVPFTGEGTLSLIEANKVDWRASDTVTPNNIMGHFIVGDDSVTLLLVEPFPGPIPLPSADYLIADVARVGLDPTANFGMSIVAS
jgi:hypothetical protein